MRGVGTEESMFGPAIPMCGHGTIGTVKAAVEDGLVVPREPWETDARGPCRPRGRQLRDGWPLRRKRAAFEYRRGVVSEWHTWHRGEEKADSGAA
jgi:Proline racemase